MRLRRRPEEEAEEMLGRGEDFGEGREEENLKIVYLMNGNRQLIQDGSAACFV